MNSVVDFEVSVDPGDPARPTVVLSGELDLASVERLRLVFAGLIGPGTSRVIVDLSALTFIDAAGIGVLLEALHLGRKFHCEFLLRRPSPTVWRILHLLALEREFPLEDRN